MQCDHDGKNSVRVLKVQRTFIQIESDAAKSKFFEIPDCQCERRALTIKYSFRNCTQVFYLTMLSVVKVCSVDDE